MMLGKVDMLISILPSVFLVKRRFPVVHDANTPCKKVYHHLGLFRMLRFNHRGIQGIHQHQSKNSSKVSSVLCWAELLYSMQSHGQLLRKHCLACIQIL